MLLNFMISSSVMQKHILISKIKLCRLTIASAPFPGRRSVLFLILFNQHWFLLFIYLFIYLLIYPFFLSDSLDSEYLIQVVLLVSVPSDMTI